MPQRDHKEKDKTSGSLRGEQMAGKLDMSRNWQWPVKYMPVFDYDRCTRCGLCATACT
jgi:ferredoxin